MRERAVQISATLEIETETSKGTVIRITVPVTAEPATPEAHV
jgi:signal transduction histidine kinase